MIPVFTAPAKVHELCDQCCLSVCLSFCLWAGQLTNAFTDVDQKVVGMGTGDPLELNWPVSGCVSIRTIAFRLPSTLYKKNYILRDTAWYDCHSLSPVHTGDKVEFNTVDFVESRRLPKPATNRQQSRLLPYTFNFVADTVDFVASVYGAKPTRSTLSTFNKVNRVEFNFVASVYWALV